MILQKILDHPWIALAFSLVFVCLWLACRRRTHRDKLGRRAEADGPAAR
jgi:hypothetical protein